MASAATLLHPVRDVVGTSVDHVREGTVPCGGTRSEVPARRAGGIGGFAAARNLSTGDLRKAAGKWQLIKKKAEGLPPPSKEEKDRLAKQYKTKLEEAQKKLFGEVARVSAIAGGRQALLEISGVLEKKGK